MQKRSKAQVGMEYLLMIGFIIFVVMGILGVALIYTEGIKRDLGIDQIGNLASKITSTAETVFYSGEPSKATISGYLPEAVTNITIADNRIYFTISTTTGPTIISYKSEVPITGTIDTSEGYKKIIIKAEDNYVSIE